MHSLNEVAALLRQHDNYLLLSHRRPDGDTIGCCAALCLGLRTMGKRAAVYPNPQFTPKYAALLEGTVAERVQGGETIVSLDTASAGLLPFGMEQAEVLLRIDHHATDVSYAAHTLVQPDKAACGEIVYALLCELGVPLTKKIAEALYAAISTDTGCFRYANVTPNTFRVAAACLEAGADAHSWNRRLFEVKRRARLELESYLVQNTRFYANGKVALSRIPAALVQSLGLTEDDLDDISGFGRCIEGVQIAVMLRELAEEGGKVSIRTVAPFSAARICERFGGGGHPGAGGATVPDGIDAAEKAVLASLREEPELSPWQAEF